MAILGAIAVPHPPLIVPAVGRGEQRRIQATIDAYEQAARELLDLEPDCIVVTSPHAPLFRDGFHVTTDPQLSGDMAQFRAPEERIDAACDVDLALEIVQRANEVGIPAVGSDLYRDGMDHGTYVPLYFVREAFKAAQDAAGKGGEHAGGQRAGGLQADSDLPCPIVRIGLSGLSPNMHRELGHVIAQAADALGRNVAVAASDASGATNRVDSLEYDLSGNVVRRVTDFRDGRVAEATAEYDMLNREVRRADALGNETVTGYDPLGRTVSTSGDAYPILSGFDSAGRKTHGFTTRDGGATWDETQWEFDPASGVNTAKEYADGSRVAYSYTDNGKKTRTTWARGVWKQHAYNVRNLVSGTTYSGTATPSVAYTYADSGKTASATLSDGTSYAYGYDDRLLNTNESVTVGGEAFSVNRTFDEFRRAQETAVVVTNVRHSAKVRLYDSEDRVCGYALTNAAGRGVSVSLAYDGSYVTNTVYTLPNGSSFSARLSREAGRRNLVTRRDYFFGGQSIYWYECDFDLLGRPTNAVDSAMLARAYDYNNRNELVSATSGTNSFAYVYDTIGNRTSASANSETNSYTANRLNQYTSIIHDSGTMCENQAPQYDADGNLTQDGRYSYTYDAENRLVSVTPTIPVQGDFSVLNTYDHRHRRIMKRVNCYDNGEWVLARVHFFAYDGNNIVLERITLANGEIHTIENFWGNDLSGSEEGAGGVGGLLAVSVDGAYCFPCYDNNGNIVRYVTEEGSIVVQFTYDPYGNVLEQAGAAADFLRIRFSTKYTDSEVGLVSYLERFYDSFNGRWLNRDPLGETGGMNLYGFTFNNPISRFDTDGRFVLPIFVIPDPETPQPDPTPNPFDQLGSDDSPLGEENWFMENYAGWLEHSKALFISEINAGVDCKGDFNGKSSRQSINPGTAGDIPWGMPIGGNDRLYGDKGQNNWQAVVVLGAFAIDYVTPVRVKYETCVSKKKKFTWETTMYVEDTLGLQGDEGFLKYFTWAAKSRRVKRASWTIRGSGTCSCCD